MSLTEQQWLELQIMITALQIKNEAPELRDDIIAAVISGQLKGYYNESN